MDDDQQQMSCEPSVWDPQPVSPQPMSEMPPPNNAPLEWCHRTADLSLLGDLGAEHWWIKHGEAESGMGAGDDGGLSTQMTNHRGQSMNPGTTCEPITDLNPAYASADPACVDGLTQPGRATGTWTPFNNCHTEVESIMNTCTPAEAFAQSSEGASGTSAEGGGTSGEGGARSY